MFYSPPKEVAVTFLCLNLQIAAFSDDGFPPETRYRHDTGKVEVLVKRWKC
jgi:hypothetical protein